jgi:hypothetical protein
MSTKESVMDIALRVAIVKSGKHQWEIAQAAGISESKLSRHLRGHGQLSEAELHRLYVALKTRVEQEHVDTGVEAQ